MSETEEQIEGIIFQALANHMRRTLLRIISAKPEGVSYSELLVELNLPTGKLNYHLEQLSGLTERNSDHRYVLTPFGKKALKQLESVKQEVGPEDEKYLRIASSAQKSSLQPTVRLFLLVGIAFACLILAVWSFIAYVAVTEGAPTIVYVLLPVLMGVGLGLLGSLIFALRKAPDWVRRFEHRFLGSG